MVYSQEDLQRIDSLVGRERITETAKLRQKKKQELQQEQASNPDRADADAKIKEGLANFSKKLKEDLKALKESGGGVVSGELNALIPLVDMAIYHNGDSISTMQLLELDLTGKIEIRNPDPNIFDKPLLQNALNAGGILGKNLKRIKAQLDKATMQVEEKNLANKFPLQRFLGAIDASKASSRERIYSYWEDIAGMFPIVKEDAEKLKIELIKFFEESLEDLEGEEKARAQKMIEKTKDTFNLGDNGLDELQYIANFPLVVDKEVLSPMHRFFNIVGGVIATEKLLGKTDSSDRAKEEVDFGDINQQFLAEAVQGLQDSDMGSTGNAWADSMEIDITDYDSGDLEWLGDIKNIQSSADPLLMFEYFKDDKLLAFSEEGASDLKKFLDEILDDIENERIEVTLDFQTDIENWLDQMDNTVTLDRQTDFFLPISVMENADFDDLYKEKYFDGVDGFEFVETGSLQEIGDFFENLYQLISEDVITFATDIRTTKGRRRGTDMGATMRGTDRLSRLSGAVRRQNRKTDSLESKINENFSDSLKGALEKFMESALEYYFTPSYSGMLTVEVPSFMGKIGGRVMQTLSLDLGKQTVMSGAYNKLMRGSAKSIKASQLKSIADFLDNMFLTSIKINDFLIESGERAAKAMTRLFGSEEENNLYFAGLIHYFMRDTGDLKLENEDFNGVSIKERAEKFETSNRYKRAFPIFALPHWLDMNQGLITQASDAHKRQYNRLKAIFEEVQSDLPVLLHKMLKAHDAIREELGLSVHYGYLPMNHVGYDAMSGLIHKEENIDLSNFEVESIVKMVDSHDSIGKEFGISSDSVYLIKSHFR